MPLHIDARNGISGNMTVAALIDLGADRENVLKTAEEAASRLTKTRARVDVVKREDTRALHIDTLCDDTSFPVEQIEAAISSADITDKEKALAILHTLVAAEQKYHRQRHIHFHEIGCADLVFDIVGTVKALELLQETDITCTKVSVGGGTVTFSHGTLDVPAPATREILLRYGIPFEKGPIDRELATPTGVAILANVVTGYSEQALVGRTGHGAGSAYEGFENVLRVGRLEPVGPGGSAGV